MRIWTIAIIASVACFSWLVAQETPKRSTDFSEGLTKRAESLKMTWADDPQRPAPTLLKTPVLRCNDPTRSEVDGAVWMWLDGKRPVTAMCVIQYAGGRWNYEFMSLCDDALQVTGRPDWSWNPIASPREWKKIDDAVPETAVARQVSIRAIARRLEATEFYRGQTFNLRLLSRPIYTYADEQNGIIEGAVFALSNGTNPECLVQLEARREKPDMWYISCGRLSSAVVNVKLDDKEIWSVERASETDSQDSYFATNEN